MLYDYYLYWSSYSQIKILIPLGHEWNATDLSEVVWNYVEAYGEAVDADNLRSSQQFIYLLALHGINKLNASTGEPLYGRKFNKDKIDKWAVMISRNMDMAPRSPIECHLMGSFLEQCIQLWESTYPGKELPSKLHFMSSLQYSNESNQLMDFYDELAEECGFIYTQLPFSKKSERLKRHHKKINSRTPFINAHSTNNCVSISDYVL